VRKILLHMHIFFLGPAGRPATAARDRDAGYRREGARGQAGGGGTRKQRKRT
jgi:hypothetical protein